MSIASRITSMENNIRNAYHGLDSIGIDTTNTNKNIENISALLEDFYDTLPKVSGSGSNISLSPTRKGRITSQINGDTFQQTYTGKNLFNKTDYTTITTSNNGSPTNVSKTSDKISFTSNSTSGFSGVYITSTNYQNYIDNYDSETTYYISADIKTDVNCDFRFAKESIVTSITTGTTRLTYNGTVPPNLAFYVKNATANIEITNIMISTSSDTTYEKYVGGQASPNPEFPQNIESVTGLQKVGICGKNLFDKNSVESGMYTGDVGDTINTRSNSNTFRHPIIPIESSYINISSSDLNVAFRVKLLDKDKKIIFNQGYSSLPQTIDTSTAKYMAIFFDATTITVDADIQIEQNSSSTTYEAYSGNDYTIHLGNMKLNKIGDYKDYITGTPDNWSIVKNIGKFVLNGTENWNIVLNVDNSNLFRIGKTDYAKNIGVYCNYYKGIQNQTGRTNFDIYLRSDNTLALDILDNRFNTTDAFKTWLSSNNAEVIYPLATPTTTPITNTELISQLNAFYYAKSKQGQTNISVDGDLPIILDVSALKGEETE